MTPAGWRLLDGIWRPPERGFIGGAGGAGVFAGGRGRRAPAGNKAADTTAPTLSSASGTQTGDTTADGSVSTDEGNGTLYWVATTSVTTPTAAQIRAGLDDGGAATAADGSQSVSSTGTQNVSVTGLTAETAYYLHFTQRDAAGNDAAPVSSSSFTTASGGGGGAQPFFEDDFEGYTVGQDPSGGSNGFSWLGDRDVEVSDELAQAGSQSLKCNYGDGAWAEQSYDLGRNVTELWVEFYVYFLDGTEGLGAAYTMPNTKAGNNNKFHSHWGAEVGNESADRAAYSENYHTYEIWPTGDNDGNGDLEMYHKYNEIESNPDSRPGGTIAFVNDGTRGRWVQWRQHARFNSDYDQTDGLSECWIDGVLQETVTGLNFEGDSQYSLYWRYGYLMGFNNTSFDPPTSVYLDGLKFYDSDPGW